jgi:hypothetical protein
MASDPIQRLEKNLKAVLAVRADPKTRLKDRLILGAMAAKIKALIRYRQKLR